MGNWKNIDSLCAHSLQDFSTTFNASTNALSLQRILTEKIAGIGKLLVAAIYRDTEADIVYSRGIERENQTTSRRECVC